jgi:hypothetical protein
MFFACWLRATGFSFLPSWIIFSFCRIRFTTLACGFSFTVTFE